jgi:hypothetical protein
MRKSQNATAAIDTGTEKGPQQQPITAQANAITPWNIAVYLLLLIPIVLFFVSLSSPPTIDWDSGKGFIVLRNMLGGGSFNIFIEPDHADISRDLGTFLSRWTPGQYIVPGAFVWLGSNYGLALSLTTLIATLTGVIGWAQVARCFAVTPFVLIAFVTGLVSFHYTTLAFRNYHGGEILLFAVAPWALYGLQRAVEKPPLICFAISLLSAALLFFAKLTGLLCFGANVLAISLLYVAREARLSASIIAMWAASVTGALLFLLFWPARELGAGSASWLDIWFPVAGTALAGFSGLDLLKTLLMHSSEMIAFDPYVAVDKANSVLGLLGLLFIILIWFRIRDTQYRAMAIFLLSIAAIYTAALIVIFYLFHFTDTLFYEERHLRYSGIIVFLLFLVAIDQSGRSLAKSCTLLVVGVFAAYGVISFTRSTLELGGGRYYDRLTGTSQKEQPAVVLEYLRSEQREHNWRSPMAVLLSPSAAITLPGFRVFVADNLPKAGRTEKIFVIVQESMLSNGFAEMLLKTFRDYEFGSWNETRIDGMVVYSQ